MSASTIARGRGEAAPPMGAPPMLQGASHDSAVFSPPGVQKSTVLPRVTGHGRRGGPDGGGRCPARLDPGSRAFTSQWRAYSPASRSGGPFGGAGDGSSRPSGLQPEAGEMITGTGPSRCQAPIMVNRRSGRACPTRYKTTPRFPAHRPAGSGLWHASQVSCSATRGKRHR